MRDETLEHLGAGRSAERVVLNPTVSEFVELGRRATEIQLSR